MTKWEIVSDPLPIGGFKVDTRFNEEELVYMLRLGTFTMGTILRHCRYGMFQVLPPNEVHQTCWMRNSRYIASVYGCKLVLIERDKQKRNELITDAG